MGFTVEDPTTVLHLSSLTPEKSTSCTPGRDREDDDVDVDDQKQKQITPEKSTSCTPGRVVIIVMQKQQR